MPMYQIPESAVKGDQFGGINVAVHVLTDDGQQAKVRIEDCGMYLRQGEIHTVPSSAVTLRGY